MRAGLPLSWSPDPTLDRYRHQPRVCACACGGTISAVPFAEAYQIREHQQTAQHQRWRKEQGL